ncbi:MAG: sodium:proton antiporter [Gammaproteobacteria bacterium]
MMDQLSTLFSAGIDLKAVLLLAAVGLIAIGAAGMVLSRDLFRIVLALAIAEAGANLMLVIAGYRFDAVAPILTGSTTDQLMVDPVPQAMVLTAIVIGVGIQAFALSVVVRIKQTYGTLDMRELRLLMTAEIDTEAAVPAQAGQDAPLGDRPIPAPGMNPMTSTRGGEGKP